MRALVFILALAATSCGAGSTSVLVEITAADGVAVTNLTLSADIAGRPDGGTGPQSLGGAMPTLPGRVVLQLPDDALTLTLTATGTSASGALTASAMVTSVVHHQVKATLNLSGLVAGGPSRCNMLPASDGVIACAGFENSADELEPIASAGTVTLDTTRAYRGNSSVKLAIDGTGSTASAEIHDDGLPNDAMYALRVFMYVPSPSLPGGVRLLGFEQDTGAYREVAITLDDSDHLAVHHAVVGGDTFKDTISATVIPYDRWVCLELRVDWGVPPNSHIRVLMDDTPIDDLDDDTATADTPRLALGLIGQYYYGAPTAPSTIWADELVIASQPIGCAE